MAQQKGTQLVSTRVRVQSWASFSELRIQHCLELWYRSQTGLGSGLMLWLWRRPSAVALIRPLAWELPYATGAALKSKIVIIILKGGFYIGMEYNQYGEWKLHRT